MRKEQGSPGARYTYGLAQDGVTVARNDTLGLEESPQVVDNLLVRGVRADFLDHAKDEGEDLLVGKTVEGTGETSKGSRVGEEGVREGRADEVCWKAKRVSCDARKCGGIKCNAREVWAETLPPSWSV